MSKKITKEAVIENSIVEEVVNVPVEAKITPLAELSIESDTPTPLETINVVKTAVNKMVSPLELANLVEKEEFNEETGEKIIENVLLKEDLTVNQKARIIEDLEFNYLNNIAYNELADELAKYGVERHFRIGKTKEIIINDALRELEKLRLKMLSEDSIEQTQRKIVFESGVTDRAVIERNIKIIGANLKNDCPPSQKRVFLAKRTALLEYLDTL